MRIYTTPDDDQAFKDWMAQHPNGYYLNECAVGNIRRGSGDMYLHKVGCPHLGTGEGVCSTTFGKAPSDDREALVTWATGRGLNVIGCGTCRPD